MPSNVTVCSWKTEKKITCAPDSLTNHPKDLKSFLITLDHTLQSHHYLHGRAVMGNSPSLSQARELPGDILSPGSRGAEDFPNRSVCLDTLVPSEESHITITCLFWPVRAVVIQGMGFFWLWQQLWCRGTVINIIPQLAFPIQIPIPVAQMQLGRWVGQEEGSPAALSMDLTSFTPFL